MNKSPLLIPTRSLQAAIVLLGMGAFAFLLGEPHAEGRNAHATTFEIYFKDPFLAYVYVGSIPFFLALCRAFRMLGRVRQDRAFSQSTVDALRAIGRCAMAIIGFAVVGELFIMLGESDDRAGGVFMGLLVIFGSVVVAATAAMFARQLQSPPARSEANRG